MNNILLCSSREEAYLEGRVGAGVEDGEETGVDQGEEADLEGGEGAGVAHREEARMDQGEEVGLEGRMEGGEGAHLGGGESARLEEDLQARVGEGLGQHRTWSRMGLNLLAQANHISYKTRFRSDSPFLSSSPQTDPFPRPVHFPTQEHC